MSQPVEIGLRDVLLARSRIAGIIRPTPLMRHPLLVRDTGCEIYIKHENHNPTGAFKVRGGLNLVASLSDDEKRRGAITASTGNHGQSIAFACQRAGIPCTVVVPVGNNPEKNAAIQTFGAHLVEHGRDFDEAREYVEERAVRENLRYVHSANEPLLIAGVGTLALEIFEELPGVDAILVPVGGGSGASGAALVRRALGSRAEVIGVQAAEADAFAQSWRTGNRIVTQRAHTFAEGMATRVTFDLTFDILRRELDDVVTLSEDDLAEGVRLSLRTTHNLAEGAGAAPLMAVLKHRERFAGKTVVCVMSGGNVDVGTLRRILN